MLPNIVKPSVAIQPAQPQGLQAAPAKPSNDAMYNLVVDGDLAQLNSMQRVQYLTKVCENVGLNPMTRPFGLIKLDGKVTLYALKEASTQLARRDGVTTKLGDFVYIKERAMLMVTVTATTPDGRATDDVAAVAMGEKLSGEAAANAYMKLATKAKRRAILTHCGLGIIDESELETAEKVEKVNDTEPKQVTQAVENRVQEVTVEAEVVERTDVAPATSLPTQGETRDVSTESFDYNNTNDRQWLIDLLKEMFPKAKRSDMLTICGTFSKHVEKKTVVSCLMARLHVEQKNKEEGKPSLVG